MFPRVGRREKAKGSYTDAKIGKSVIWHYLHRIPFSLFLHYPVFIILGNLRNAVFYDGDDRMSFLLPDDVVGLLDPPSGFGADVKMEVLPLPLEREENVHLLGSKEYFLISLLCD